MFLVNYLSRNDMDQFAPLFEIICGTELFFIALTLVAASVVVKSVLRTSKLHRLVRLRMIFGINIACLYVLSRLVVMYHQFFGPSEHVEPWPLIIASMIKEVFFGYMTSLISILALDRLVATTAWAWYESGADSTLFFFALQEAIIISISLPIAYLLIYEHITSMDSVYIFGAIVFVGAIFFVAVYKRNLREVRELRRGAVVNQYSISRTYQIRENIAVLESITKLSRPLVIVCLPPLVFFPIFALVPPNIGYDGLRFISVGMYDLWLAIASAVVISLLPYYFPRIRNSQHKYVFIRSKSSTYGASVHPISNMNKLEKVLSQNANTVFRNAVAAGDIYFSLLENDLKKPAS